ncbi:hypothetical protein DFH07DRAFT_971699 [Mycena maculata]|uniref:Uncharacterized protein n=1 Tax=Mycena maculata TaxID=230809 RepID=A0AAD7HKX6_9AGAR|nr:hypothetical protein DFH07DRAFT_971699 [Mycena maculata]
MSYPPRLIAHPHRYQYIPLHNTKPSAYPISTAPVAGSEQFLPSAHNTASSLDSTGPVNQSRLHAASTPVAFSPTKGSPLKFPQPVYSPHPLFLPFPERLLPEMGIYPPDAPQQRHAEGSTPSLPPQYREMGPELTATSTPPAIYAASGLQNILFKNRAEAFALFESTDGADIFFPYSLQEAIEFFDMTPPTIYAVSGHRVGFKNPYVFLKTDGTKMLFSKSSEELEVFISKHAG